MPGERDETFIPTRFVDALKLEYMQHPTEDEQKSYEKTARRILREATPYVTMGLVDMALNEPDPRIRLSATNAILDRTLGKAGVFAAEESSPVDDLYNKMMEDIEAKLVEEANK